MLRRYAPYAAWVAAVGGFTLACAVLLPSARAQYDFFAGGAVVVHVVDRALLPIAIAQNGTSVLPALLAFLIAYVIAYAAYERMLRRPDRRAAVAAYLAGALCALAVPLSFTSDPYAYALYGLESGPLHLNPYAVHAAELSRHPWGSTLAGIFPNPNALARTCNYGPVFALLYGGIAAALQKTPLLAFLLAERVLGAVAVAVAAAGIASAEPNEPPAQRTRRALSFALHPLVLFEFVTFAHGDVLMLAALAWAYASWRRDRFVLAGVLCGIAICIRVVAVLALAAFAVELWRRGRAVFGRGVLAAVAALAGCAGISFARFGAFSLGGPPIFNAYSAPFLALASMSGIGDALALGFVLEAVAGVSLSLALLYRAAISSSFRSLVWVPLAALVAGPSFYLHYGSWFVGLRGITQDPRAIRAMRTLSLAAPLVYVVHVDPFPAPGVSPAVQMAVLAAVWMPVLLAVIPSARGRDRRRASPR